MDLSVLSLKVVILFWYHFLSLLVVLMSSCSSLILIICVCFLLCLLHLAWDLSIALISFFIKEESGTYFMLFFLIFIDFCFIPQFLWLVLHLTLLYISLWTLHYHSACTFYFIQLKSTFYIPWRLPLWPMCCLCLAAMYHFYIFGRILDIF